MPPVDELDKDIADDSPLESNFDELSAQKVQLDIDDAPFLEEPEEIPAARPEKSAPAPAEEEEEAAPQSKKKKFIFLGVFLLVLLAAIGVVLKMFVFVEPPNPVIVVVQPEPLETAKANNYIVPLAPFMVPLFDEEDNSYFLEAAFNLYILNPMLYLEGLEKGIPLRDAIYYYLSNQSYEFLHNPANIDQIKQDLADAVNEVLMNGLIDDILFERYLIR